MFKPVTLALALTLTAAVQADTDCNVPMREGSLVHLSNPSEVTYESMSVEGKFEEGKRQPKEGFKYAVLSLKLGSGRSVGIYDYALQTEAGGSEYKVLGILAGDGPYQRKIWEVRASGNNKVQWDGIYEQNKPSRKGSEVLEANTIVKLLFEVPADSGNRFKLISLLLDKSLQKEYGVKQILDFDDMSKAVTPPKAVAKEAPAEEEKPAQ